MPQVQARQRASAAEALPRNIFALLEVAAQEYPQREALVFIASGEIMRYGQLRRDVNRLANGFRAIGIGHGSHVAVMLPNVPPMPLTWLALARIGAVMVPVNVRYTGRELDYALSDSGANHLIIHEDLVSVLADLPAAGKPQGAVIVVGAKREGFLCWRDLLEMHAAEGGPPPEPGLDDLMNIQYTSGTTGLPKGCLLTQRYWLTCAKAYASCDGLSFGRILSANPFFYMTPQWLLLMAFFHRATLYVAPHLSLTRYIDWIKRYRIEFCIFPVDAMDHTPPAADDRDNAVRRANIHIHRKERHAEVEQRFGFPTRTAFGMTEIGFGLYTPLEAAEMVGSGSCGLPAPFREARIADPEGRTLPPDQAGELLIRGPGILRGYHNKPEATAASFHGDWFRTGDMARQDTNGFVTIVGRIKEMIRRAGENISATEVEMVVLGLPQVAEAAAVPVPDTLRGEEVKIYVVLQPGLTPSDLPPEQIVAHCRKQLAVFKLPRFIGYRSAKLPRSISGKVQKPQLIAEAADLRADSWDGQSGAWANQGKGLCPLTPSKAEPLKSIT